MHQLKCRRCSMILSYQKAEWDPSTKCWKCPRCSSLITSLRTG